MTEHYAPLVIGPFDVDSNQVQNGIELVLQPGFKAQVRLQNPSGQLIREAKVDFNYHHQNATFNHDALTSDENGLITFKHTTSIPMTLSVRTPGYQFDLIETTLDRDRLLDWTLMPAQPTTGTLIAQESGEPVANPPLYLLCRKGFHDRVYDARRHSYSQTCLATSDDQGRFVLDSLRDDCLYALYIDGTEDYAPDIFPGIVAGQQDVQLKVNPPRVIQGRILGDYDPERRRLNGSEEVPVIQYGNDLHFGNCSYSCGFHAPLEKLDDQPGWSFKIANVLPNDVTLSLRGYPTRTIPKVTQAIDDYVIDLRPGAIDPSVEEQETRKVVVQLHAPEGWPVPTGKIRVDHVMVDRNGYKPYWLDLQEGRVEIDVPMLAHGQGKFKYESGQDLVGYWIEEKSGIPIPPGDTPYVIDVPAYPAGAIHGVVVDEKGQPVNYANVYMETVQKSPDAQDKRMGLDHSVDVGPEGRFVFSPLPLEGTYVLWAYRSQGRDRFLAFSQELTVTREAPTQNVTLKLPEGKTLKGRVVASDGQGIPQAEVRLNYQTKHGSHGGSPVTTDAQGDFQFDHVNTDADCQYTYRVACVENYCGCEVPVQFSGVQEIALVEGLVLHGRVIDCKSGGLVLVPISEKEWAQGIRDLNRATEADGVFCYTFFKAVVS